MRWYACGHNFSPVSLAFSPRVVSTPIDKFHADVDVGVSALVLITFMKQIAMSGHIQNLLLKSANALLASPTARNRHFLKLG